jgi:nitrogen regulatory protein P-II 1
MKEISIFIRTDDLAEVTGILKKHNVGGLSFYEVSGAGKSKRDAVPEVVRSYMTGRMITPDYVKRTKVETIVPDSTINPIVDDLINNFNTRTGANGMVFVKEVSDAYEIGTDAKQTGEAVLSTK